MVNAPEDRDPTLSAVEEKILRERDEILAERAELIERRQDLLLRLRRADRRLADCRAAARLFGLNIEFPEEQQTYETIERVRASREHEARAAAAAAMRANTEARLMEAHRLQALKYVAAQAPPSISPATVPEEQPQRQAIPTPAPKTLREVVLDRLAIAGDGGSKAATIRDFYERTFGKSIHEKTVGMTLYRLLKEGLVRRDGHIWFFVPPQAETENPGVGAPGSGLFE